MKLKHFSIFFSIFLFVLYSCNRNKEIKINDYHLIDSIKYYNNKINFTNLDSKKKIFIEKTERINKNIKNDSIRLKNYDTIAFNFFNIGDFVKYKHITKLNLEESLNTKDTLRIIKSYINFGNYYLRRYVHDSAYYCYDKAQLFYIKKNQFENTNELAINKATIQYFKSDYLGCETSILKSLSYLKKQNNTQNLNAAYTLIGLSKIELGEYNEAKESLNLALELSKKINDNKGAYGLALNNLGFLFFKQNEFQDAIKFYEMAIKDEGLKKYNYHTYLLSEQYLLISKFKLKKEDDFEKKILILISKIKEYNITSVQSKVFLSELYKYNKNFSKAKNYAIDAYETSIKEKAYRDKLLALKQLSDVFPEKAKFYSDEYVKLKDSIADVDKKTSNTFARIEYRVDELNEKNVELEQRNKNLILYSLLIGLFGVLFYFYTWRQAKKREMILIQANNEANEKAYQLMLNEQQQLEEVKEQEQKRISRDIHDAVLGRLFGIRMNLDFLNTKNDNDIIDKRKSYILELQEVENNLRQISHQLSDEKKEIMNNFKIMLDKLVIQQENLQLSEINYKILTEIPWEKITDEQKINLYRIIQESFQNINKYAKAKMINFELSFEKPFFQISIKDDGIGFNTKKKSKGIGLNNMKERAKLIGASFEIVSNINEGTQTTILLNLEITKTKKNEIT